MGKIVFFVLILIGLFFLAPLVVLTGWNCARELWPTLPEATYWQAFWISNAIALMFKPYHSSSKS